MAKREVSTFFNGDNTNLYAIYVKAIQKYIPNLDDSMIITLAILMNECNKKRHLFFSEEKKIKTKDKIEEIDTSVFDKETRERINSMLFNGKSNAHSVYMSKMRNRDIILRYGIPNIYHKYFGGLLNVMLEHGDDITLSITIKKNGKL